MKTLLPLAVLIVMALGQEGLPDPQEFLKDGPRVARLISCLQGKGTCEPFAMALRNQLPAAIRTSCAECSKVQKIFIRTVGLELKKNHADEYKVIEDYFDKERKYKKAFDEFLQASD